MYDVAIIGAGVTGSAIARELSRYRLKLCVIEREEDVCCGTSKANSGIVHAGFDAEPSTLKAKFNVAGNRMMDRIAEELDVPFIRNGSAVVCTGNQDPAGLDALMERGRRNGVKGLRVLNREELLKKEPNLSERVTCGLFAPSGGIVCPFELTMGFAENACSNGAKFLLNTEVGHITKNPSGYTLFMKSRENSENMVLSARVVINAAGVYADELNNMVSSRKLHITPRRGEYLLLDKAAGAHVGSTIFRMPSEMGKGVLVTPTVHGNLLLGPTAEDIADKEAVCTTAPGLDSVSEKAGWTVKDLPLRQVITSFAGLRAHEDGGDFVIGEAEGAPGFINAAGIESPGLTSAPAIGAFVAELVSSLLGAEKKTDFNPIRRRVLNPFGLSVEERNRLIAEDPAYGRIVCRCEMVTEGEILDAIHRPLGARSLDGVKRRTRAGMGRCQAGFCTPRVMELLVREVPMTCAGVTKNGPGSGLIVGTNKQLSEGN